jgi:hypothetical protein
MILFLESVNLAIFCAVLQDVFSHRKVVSYYFMLGLTAILRYKFNIIFLVLAVAFYLSVLLSMTVILFGIIEEVASSGNGPELYLGGSRLDSQR